MTELKPCPFCGGEARQREKVGWNEGMYKYGIGCFRCLCEVMGFKTEDEAIEAWNTRSPQSLTKKVKWPEKKKEIEQDPDHASWGNADDSYGHGYDIGYANAFNDAVEACKQSLNQASQEDRDKLFRFIKAFTNLSDEGNLRLARAILKEYVLVRREK